MKKMIGTASAAGILFYAATSVICGIVFLTSAVFQSAVVRTSGDTFTVGFGLGQTSSSGILLLLLCAPVLSAIVLAFAVISMIFLLRGTDIRVYAAVALGFVLAGSLIILLLPPQSYAIAEYRMCQHPGDFGAVTIHLISSLLLAGILLMHILYFIQIRRKAGVLPPRP